MVDKIGADLNALLKLHHERLSECRRRNELLVERTIAALIILVGLIAFGSAEPHISHKFFAVLGVILGTIGVCVILYKNNQTYMQNAKTIQNINRMLLLYEHKAEIKKSIYPSEWETFGDKNPVRVCLPFWFYISGIAIVATIVTLLG